MQVVEVVGIVGVDCNVPLLDVLLEVDLEQDALFETIARLPNVSLCDGHVIAGFGIILQVIGRGGIICWRVLLGGGAEVDQGGVDKWAARVLVGGGDVEVEGDGLVHVPVLGAELDFAGAAAGSVFGVPDGQKVDVSVEDGVHLPRTDLGGEDVEHDLVVAGVSVVPAGGDVRQLLEIEASAVVFAGTGLAALGRLTGVDAVTVLVGGALASELPALESGNAVGVVGAGVRLLTGEVLDALSIIVEGKSIRAGWC